MILCSLSNSTQNIKGKKLGTHKRMDQNTENSELHLF